MFKTIALSLFTIIFSISTNAYSQIQHFKCEVLMGMDGRQTKISTLIEISDSIIVFKSESNGQKSYKYKIISKSLNGESYKVTDGVFQSTIGVEYFEKPPIKTKGMYYHYWISHTSTDPKFQYTYLGEKGIK